MRPFTVYDAPSGTEQGTAVVFVFLTWKETGNWAKPDCAASAGDWATQRVANAPAIPHAGHNFRALHSIAIAVLYHLYAMLSLVNRSGRGGAEIRRALIEAAARLIATEGTGALTLRRVADEVGTSTMAIYTHFGGMPELRRAVRREGFARLAARGADVGESEDPVADVAMLGIEYYEHAVSDPHLYRVMYLEQPLDEADAESGWGTFDTLANAMQRCIDVGRFSAADAEELAREFWALGHGVITLQLADLLSPEQARSCLVGAVRKLFSAYGDDPGATAESFARVADRTQPRLVPGA